jgi:hypothetical protein
MGMMPEGRSRRWQSLFRRYGIAADTEADAPQDKEAPEPDLPQAQDILRPKQPLDREARSSRRRGRAR